MKGNPILITGSHRSGTTLVGKVISLNPKVAYLSEPFNPLSVKKSEVDNFNTSFDHWFTYITKENEKKYIEGIKNTLSFKYKPKNPKRLRENLKNRFRFFLYRSKKTTPLLKDPIALFSAPWLKKRFKTRVIILIRHPAAFASSLKRLNWQFDFANFLNQPFLMRDYLSIFGDEIKEYAKTKPDIIDQAILLWRIFYFVIKKYQKEHPDWMFVRLEDLSRKPEKTFEEIFSYLDLKFTNRIKKTVQDLCSPSNPQEVLPGRSHAMELKRDSKANIYNYKKRLSKDEIEKIKEETKDVWGQFFKEKDW